LEVPLRPICPGVLIKKTALYKREGWVEDGKFGNAGRCRGEVEKTGETIHRGVFLAVDVLFSTNGQAVGHFAVMVVQ